MMELADYRDQFLRGQSSEGNHFTAKLESEANSIRQVIGNTAQPSQSDLERVRRFLIDVEMWKADCMEERTGNAVKNPPHQIWASLQGAITASRDLSALLSIMDLVGFGSSRDENTGIRRAKRATAVLRFLDPDEWGVVDWRTIAMLTFYKRNKFCMDRAVEDAKTLKKREAAKLFDVVDEKAALEIVEEYRSMRDQRSPRTVDVELALYGASFLAWPRSKKKTARRA